MSKPNTEADFSDQLDNDRAWRIKEISDLKLLARRADANAQRAVLRALNAICYAHWEGHVKFVARKYLEHIALRKLHFSKLTPQFLRNFFLPRLANLGTQNKSVSEKCRLLDEIIGAPEKRYSKVNDSLVNTKSNLNLTPLETLDTILLSVF